MGVFNGLFLTTRGKALQAKAQAGATLHYTRIGIGDGSLAGTPPTELTQLISEKKSIPISKLQRLSGGKAVVGGVFTNTGLATGFYFREFGVYAQDPDLGEILYCYGNAGSSADFIPPDSGSDVLERHIAAVTIVGNAENVTASIDQSLVFITIEDFNEHVDATNGVHGATSAATPATIAQRDANGQFEVGAPTAANHVARKTDLDAHTAITNGAHGATSAAMANRIVQRDANGRAKFAAPAASDDAARKAEVDAAISMINPAVSAAIGGKQVPGNDLNNATKAGRYYFTNTTANRPFEYGTIDVIVSDGDTYNGVDNWIWQIGYGTAGEAPKFRSRVNSGAWGQWVSYITDRGGTISGNVNVKGTGFYPLIVETSNASGGGIALRPVNDDMKRIELSAKEDGAFRVYQRSASADTFIIESDGAVKIPKRLGVDGSMTVWGGGGSLALKPGSSDHVYMEFYADSQAPNNRSGYIGYASPGDVSIHVQNSLGNIDLLPKAGGLVYTPGTLSVNGNFVVEPNGNVWRYGQLQAQVRVNGGMLQYWNGSAWVNAGKRWAGGSATARYGGISGAPNQQPGQSVFWQTGIGFRVKHLYGWCINTNFGGDYFPFLMDYDTNRMYVGVITSWPTTAWRWEMYDFNAGGYGFASNPDGAFSACVFWNRSGTSLSGEYSVQWWAVE